MNVVDREEQLLHAVQQYQDAIDAGRRPDRTAFLASHPDLAGELAPYLEALDVINVGTAAMSDTAAPEVMCTTTPLGDFSIVREIGRGGMGVVYEAIQLSLGRRVALKVLPFAAALDGRQLQRFKNEAMAAAQLHHNHIVPVYAVGCERGVHFYAMQLIDGLTLAELIAGLNDANKKSSVRETAVQIGTRRSQSSLGEGDEFFRQSARLMAQAALALEHAHQNGVVHRDIKPGNLLLDARGHIWVADFGLAQFQDGIDLTRTGDVLGTLRYMSPEQASGQRVPVDPRTDVYSLGATFYELLTHQPVFPGSSRAELLRQIVSDEPRPLRTVRRGVPAELETILLKCLSKTPGDRYASGQELADDLERFLTHKPILARRPGVIERSRKWARRHPGVVVVSVVLLLLATVGLLISHALVSEEQRRTAEALKREQIRAEQAERRLQQSRQLIDWIIALSEEELQDYSPLQSLRRRLLETALAHFEMLLRESRDDADAEKNLAAAQDRVKQTLADLVTLQGADSMWLLNSDAVLDELKLNDEQRRAVRELAGKQSRERMEAVFASDLSHAERRQKQVDQARAGEQSLNEMLTREQRTRLRQIALQVRGLQAFGETDVLNALKLTPVQRQKIRDIEAE